MFFEKKITFKPSLAAEFERFLAMHYVLDSKEGLVCPPTALLAPLRHTQMGRWGRGVVAALTTVRG